MKHQGVDHSLSGVRAGGEGRKTERETHLTNVSGIERKSSITYSADKCARARMCVCELCLLIFREPFVLLHLKKAQWEC